MSATSEFGALDAIGAGGVIAILRGDFRPHIDAIVDALVEGGVRAIEISLASPAALPQIEAAAVHSAGRATIGAGTVLSADDVRDAAAAGASFMVSPVVDADGIRAALARGLVPVPGAYTPTEALLATRLGAPAVKLFPADTLGPAFVRGLLAPLPFLKLIPTGGVTLDRAASFAAAGAWAVGVGTPLVGPPVPGDLAARAAGFVRAMRDGR